MSQLTQYSIHLYPEASLRICWADIYILLPGFCLFSVPVTASSLRQISSPHSSYLANVRANVLFTAMQAKVVKPKIFFDITFAMEPGRHPAYINVCTCAGWRHRVNDGQTTTFCWMRLHYRKKAATSHGISHLHFALEESRIIGASWLTNELFMSQVFGCLSSLHAIVDVLSPSRHLSTACRVFYWATFTRNVVGIGTSNVSE